MSADTISDYLAPEPKIRARLRERLDERIPVLTAHDLESVAAAHAPLQAVYAFWSRDLGIEPAGAGKVANIEQLYLTVVGVRNLRDLRGGSAARADAGPILITVARALMGFAPLEDSGGGWSALELVTAPGRASYSEGRLLAPLAFKTRFQLRSDS